MKINKEVIGNLIAYVAKNCSNPYLTNILKLLYIIDEEAVKEYGVPVTMLEYQVWQYGPVSTDVYYSRNAGENRFAHYMTPIKHSSNIILSPIIEPDMGLFSDAERSVIERVLSSFGQMSANELVEYTHRQEGLWSQIKNIHNLDFEKEGTNSSEYTIDFSLLLREQPDKLANYHSAMENAQYAASFV